MHKSAYNSETIWYGNKAKINAQITVLIDDVYWFWDFNDEYFRRLREINFDLKVSDKNGI